MPPAEEPEEMPLPSDPKVIFLGGLFYPCAAGDSLCRERDRVAIVFAIILELLQQPAMRILERLQVPRILAALLLILALFGNDRRLGHGYGHAPRMSNRDRAASGPTTSASAVAMWPLSGDNRKWHRPGSLPSPCRRCLAPATTAIPAAAAQQENDKNDDENRSHIHVRLLCVLSANTDARRSTVRASVEFGVIT